MKIIITYLTALMLALLFSVTCVFGQTTQEEYNYITKGYKVQIESGLDMKKGYVLLGMGDWGLNFGTEKRNCEFKLLVNQDLDKPCAIMMIYKRTDIANGVNYYICIPSPKSSPEIWEQTLNFVNTYFTDKSVLQAVIWALMHFSSQDLALIEEASKIKH